VHNRDSHENGLWGDADSGLCSKSLPHSHHTPLVQIRNDPPVKAELLHIGRNLFASQFSVLMKSQVSHTSLLWTEFLLSRGGDSDGGDLNIASNTAIHLKVFPEVWGSGIFIKK